MASPDEFMTIAEVASLTRETAGGWYNRRARGDGPPAYKVGTRVLYRRRDIEAWLEAQRDPQPA